MFIQIFSRNWNLLAADIQLNFPLKSILVYSLIIIHWPSLVYLIWKAVLTKILSYWKMINNKIINECLNEGITEHVNDNDTSDANYYLLHRPVVREERETQRKLELYRMPQPKHQDIFFKWLITQWPLLVTNNSEYFIMFSSWTGSLGRWYTSRAFSQVEINSLHRD